MDGVAEVLAPPLKSGSKDNSVMSKFEKSSFDNDFSKQTEKKNKID